MNCTACCWSHTARVYCSMAVQIMDAQSPKLPPRSPVQLSSAAAASIPVEPLPAAVAAKDDGDDDDDYGDDDYGDGDDGFDASSSVKSPVKLNKAATPKSSPSAATVAPVAVAEDTNTTGNTNDEKEADDDANGDDDYAEDDYGDDDGFEAGSPVAKASPATAVTVSPVVAPPASAPVTQTDAPADKGADEDNYSDDGGYDDEFD